MIAASFAAEIVYRGITGRRIHVIRRRRGSSAHGIVSSKA
jgi:hypothetical protein